MRTLTAIVLLLGLLTLPGCSSASKTQGPSPGDGKKVDIAPMTWTGISTEAIQAIAQVIPAPIR